ncbi:alpha/beta fold hydrolase [Streptomyces sp. NPDC021093]|uniref:alpha/beta fold hydrolase n=1 Tax=Streptomyces sp. NPDC021093 TaxID=3365112 RepID=UPI0037A2B145
MTHRRISLAALALLGVAACTPPGATSSAVVKDPVPAGKDIGAGTARFDAQKIRWGACTQEDVNEGVTCGRLTVPVDWEKKDSRTVDLQVYRWEAADRAKKRGTILNMPPGPGDSGYMGFSDLRKHLPQYDLIALDPRGIGNSGPLQCPSANALKVPRVPPTTEAGFAALRANQSVLWSKCRTEPAGLKNHLDAFSNAKDAEVLRKSLGLERINLYGFSYGTLTAERYLGLFGEHVNGSLLEGVMNPVLSRRDFVTSAAAANEALYRRFSTWCEKDAACVLRGQDVPKVLEQARRKARDGELPGTLNGLPWSESTVTAYLETALGNNRFGDAAKGLKDLSEGRHPEPEEGGGSGGQEEVPPEVPYADPIVCSSFDLAVKSPKDAEGDLASTRRAAPVLRYSTNSSAYSSLCVGAPAPAAGSSAPVTSRSDRPAMLLSNTYDPSTPRAWADGVARQLGKKALHTVTDAIGHGGAFSNTATRQKIVDYFDRSNKAS